MVQELHTHFLAERPRTRGTHGDVKVQASEDLLRKVEHVVVVTCSTNEDRHQHMRYQERTAKESGLLKQDTQMTLVLQRDWAGVAEVCAHPIRCACISF